MDNHPWMIIHGFPGTTGGGRNLLRGAINNINNKAAMWASMDVRGRQHTSMDVYGRPLTSGECFATLLLKRFKHFNHVTI